MKKRLRLFALLAVLLLLSLAVSAANGTIGVYVQNDLEQPVKEINVELLQVAKKQNNNYVLTEEFADLSVSAAQLKNSPTAERAETVYQYAMAKEIMGKVEDTDALGMARFGGLEDGVYLLFERGGQVVSFHPYLVVLPMSHGNQIMSSPKTSQTETETFWVCKLWQDSGRSAFRPQNVKVTLLRDGTAFREVTLNEKNLWQYTFFGLPITGEYTVEEQPVTGYTAAYTPVIGGCIITNTAAGGGGGGGGGVTPTYAHVSVTKLWQDNENAENTRPQSITVQLIRESSVVKTATLSKDNFWQYSFTELDPAGQYTVRELPVEGYEASYSGNAAVGITITNTKKENPRTPDTPPPVTPDETLTDIQITKVWNDQNNAAGKRPQAVEVHLISGGSILSTVTLQADSGWTGAFSKVPDDLHYTVWEAAVGDYSAAYSGNAAQGFTVTNTYTQGTTDPGRPPDPTPVTPPTPPADPAEPTDPVEPADPTDPVEPVTPSEPTEPSEPTVPANPVQPTIPQTGKRLRPVYLLLGLGLMLLTVGISFCTGKEEDCV